MKTLIWLIVLAILSIVSFYVVIGLVGGVLGTVLSIAVPFVLGYGLGKIRRVPKAQHYEHGHPVGPS